MIKGTTKSGFNYEIPNERLNNYELLECIAELEEEPLLLAKTVNLLLGKDQAKLLKDHLRTEDKTVPMDKMSEEIIEIFKSQPETKNS